MSATQGLSSKEIKNAYLKGLQLKKTGLDVVAISSRLEQEGFSKEFAQQVAAEVMVAGTRNEAVNKQIESGTKPTRKTILIRLGVSIVFGFVTFAAFPDNLLIPIGVTTAMVVTAFFMKENNNK